MVTAQQIEHYTGGAVLALSMLSVEHEVECDQCHAGEPCEYARRVVAHRDDAARSYADAARQGVLTLRNTQS